MKKVAIENTLRYFKDYFEQNNVKVDVLNSSNKESRDSLNQYDAIIVTGADENLMGIENTITSTPIINAQGKTAEEVFIEIDNRLGK